uniref:Uncharacterized protein n=1 Tax=Arundo donax TaxID=35708 RepID=A0A0A9H2K3_ARUDO
MQRPPPSSAARADTPSAYPFPHCTESQPGGGRNPHRRCTTTRVVSAPGVEQGDG